PTAAAGWPAGCPGPDNRHSSWPAAYAVSRSCDGRNLLEAGLAPFARGHDLRQAMDGVPDIDITQIERREAEAQDVGRTEIADHPTVDQGLHDRIALRMREGDLAAALGGVAIAAHVKASATLQRQIQEEISQ